MYKLQFTLSANSRYQIQERKHLKSLVRGWLGIKTTAFYTDFGSWKVQNSFVHVFFAWAQKHIFNRFCRTVTLGNNIFTELIVTNISSVQKNPAINNSMKYLFSSCSLWQHWLTKIIWLFRVNLAFQSV